jgi:hypothetical protein
MRSVAGRIAVAFETAIRIPAPSCNAPNRSCKTSRRPKTRVSQYKPGQKPRNSRRILNRIIPRPDVGGRTVQRNTARVPRGIWQKLFETVAGSLEPPEQGAPDYKVRNVIERCYCRQRTSDASPPATTNSPETSSPQRASPLLSSSGYS